MTREQDDLIARLMAGEFGPWGGQGFVPGGITILRPDTMQWETIIAVPGDAELTESTLGTEVAPGSTLEYAQGHELYPGGGFGLQTFQSIGGIPVTVGLGAGMGGHAMASVVPAGNYTWQNFTETELGQVRLTIGMSNGATGPLSPIKMGAALQQVDKDGNKWLPVVRMENEKQTGGGGSW